MTIQTQVKNSPKWQILIRRKEKNRNKIIYTKVSNIVDPEEAWSTVFSRWLENHRDYTIIRLSRNGLVVKDSEEHIFELIVDYKRLNPVH